MGLNTKCRIHGNAHPDFMCPEDWTDWLTEEERAYFEVAYQERLRADSRSIIGLNHQFANAYRSLAAAREEVAILKAAQDCTTNDGWLQDDLECSIDGDPACAFHLKAQLNASREEVARLEGRMCLICGRDTPCELDKRETSPDPTNWPGSPCTFDPSPIEAAQRFMRERDALRTLVVEK